MYRLLVTVTIEAGLNDGAAAIHQVVIEFPNEKEANLAYKNIADNPSKNFFRTVTKLY